MPIFDRDSETARLENLKKLEDLRMAFAEKMDKEGFRPEKMLFCSTEDGRFVALARRDNRQVIIVSPVFGQEGDFIVESADRLIYRCEDVSVKGTGLNGMFGFGQKPAVGYNYVFTLSDGSEYTLQVVGGRTSFLECDYKHNPLLKLKRRRGNANLMWDFMPFDRSQVMKVAQHLTDYYLV